MNLFICLSVNKVSTLPVTRQNPNFTVLHTNVFGQYRAKIVTEYLYSWVEETLVLLKGHIVIYSNSRFFRNATKEFEKVF